MQITLTPIGVVQATRQQTNDDFWGGSTATITLADGFSAEALTGLAAFSHIEVLFYFHQVPATAVVTGARHPRQNPNWPRVGIFAQRGKNRPNRLGSTLCRLVSVRDCELVVAELDAIDGTPVLDIKPVMREFLPRQAVEQPSWASELMQDYWR